MIIFDNLGIDMGYVLIGVTGLSLLLFIIILILSIKMGKINKKYKKFMQGATGENLESQFLKRFNEIDELQYESKKVKEKLRLITDNLTLTYQKMGIVKYDAFKEMGGKLSFALALLNDNNDGFLINSMHSSREGCYTYVKEIIKGESFVTLAEEEKKALEQAKKSDNFME